MRRQLCLAVLLAWALCLCGAAAGAERLLLEKKSQYNTILVSEEDNGLRILRFERDGARQTVVKLGDPDHLELPYAQVIPVAFAFVENPKTVLVVGLGGGTIPAFLRQRFSDLVIDAVELDPAVVDVAKSHFGFREDAKMRAYVGDGRRFIEQASRRYDIIFLDAFGIDSVPYQLATSEFLALVRRALTPRGMVVGNIWNRNSNPLYDSMVRTYLAVYDEVYIVDVPGAGNKILVALPWKSGLAKENVIAQSRELTRRLALRTDLVDMVERGFRRVGAKDVRGRILTDAAPPARK